MLGRRDKRRYGAIRAVLALIVAVACLGSVAYATTRSDGARSGRDRIGHRSQDQRQQEQRPPRPRFIEVPAAVGVDGTTRFRFHVIPRPQKPGSSAPGHGQSTQPAVRWRRFECRLDGGDWSRCSSPHVLVDLSPGDHHFAVRALSRQGRPGPAAHDRWSQLEPKEFSIDPLLGSLRELMPGAPPQQLPVRIGNPNPVPIEVTSLTVAVAPDQPGCAGDPNFEVTPSSLSPAAPLRVPAGGTAALPSAAATAPTLAMRELPVDQDACQGATLHLSFSGEARG